MEGKISAREFNLFYSQYRDKFIAIAISYVHNRTIAEDIVSECLLNYWTKIQENLEINTLPEAYVLKSIKNRCLNHLRNLQNRHKVIEEVSDEAFLALQNEIKAYEGEDLSNLFTQEALHQLQQVFMELPEETRRIFLLSREEGMTYKEIAQKLSISERMVKRHISKALELFKTRMGNYFPALLYLFIHFL